MHCFIGLGLPFSAGSEHYLHAVFQPKVDFSHVECDFPASPSCHCPNVVPGGLHEREFEVFHSCAWRWSVGSSLIILKEDIVKVLISLHIYFLCPTVISGETAFCSFFWVLGNPTKHVKRDNGEVPEYYGQCYYSNLFPNFLSIHGKTVKLLIQMKYCIFWLFLTWDPKWDPKTFYRERTEVWLSKW